MSLFTVFSDPYRQADDASRIRGSPGRTANPVAAVDSGRSGHETNHLVPADCFSCFAQRRGLRPLARASQRNDNVVGRSDIVRDRPDGICRTDCHTGTNGITGSNADANRDTGTQPDIESDTNP